MGIAIAIAIAGRCNATPGGRDSSLKSVAFRDAAIGGIFYEAFRGCAGGYKQGRRLPVQASTLRFLQQTFRQKLINPIIMVSVIQRRG